MSGRQSQPCRIWILNHYATPPDQSAGTRHFALGRELVQKGFDVTVFAAGFEHGTGREARLRGPSLSRIQTYEGVRFVWLRTFPYHGNNWRRMINMASYAVMATLVQIGRPRPDVVVGSTVHPLAALAGWLIARLRNARFIYEVRDLWPQTLLDIGALSGRHPATLALATLESFLVRQAGVVISVLPGMRDYLEGKGLPSDHVRYLPNGVDLVSADKGDAAPRGRDDLLAPLLEDLKRRRGSGEVIFAWLGAHGRVNRLDTVVRALATVRDRGGPPMSVLFVGDGPEKPELERLAAALDVRNAVFVEPIPKDRVPDLLSAVDAGVCHYTSTPVYRYGVSFNKLFDYMGARKPIVFACETYRDPVALAGAGYSIAPDDPAALADALIGMAQATPNERQRMGDAGRRFAEREHDLGHLGELFAQIVACDRAPTPEQGAAPVS